VESADARALRDPHPSCHQRNDHLKAVALP